MIKIGLKPNACFLWGQMNGDTLGGSMGGVYWTKIMYVTEKQFEKFKNVIIAFGGDVEKSLIKTIEGEHNDEVDYDCYFHKVEE